MEFCVYYDNKKGSILEFLPNNIDPKTKNDILTAWNNLIQKDILLLLSDEGQLTAPRIKERIGHSASTLHENIKRLEELRLVKTEMVYSGNKQKVLQPRILFVTRNPKFKVMFQKFFQGMWVDSEKMKAILHCLESDKNKYFTIEEISQRTKIPIDEIELLMDNWDSQLTRAFSDFLEDSPFEKKLVYKSKK